MSDPDPTMDEIPALFDQDTSGWPDKTFTDLINEGIPHAGGLAQLAAAEQCEDPGPQLAGVRYGYLVIMARRGDPEAIRSLEAMGAAYRPSQN